MKLSFTGSTEIGRLLTSQCASTLKKMSLELGGNAPFIVFDDSDLDAAVAGEILSKYRNAGQTCVCANRLLVLEGVYDVFAAKLAEAVKGLNVGNGMEEGIYQGPLIDGPALAKVQELLRDAAVKGARIICGGKAHSLGRTFFEPAIVAGVTSEMRMAKEEIFGPVAPLFKFKTEIDAIRMANDTEFGLAVLILLERHRPRLAGKRGLGIQHGRNQLRADIQRGGAVRRRQAIRDWAGWVQAWHRGLYRNQIHLHGRHR